MQLANDRRSRYEISWLSVSDKHVRWQEKDGPLISMMDRDVFEVFQGSPACQTLARTGIEMGESLRTGDYLHPNGSRFVTSGKTQSLYFIGAQSGRWRVGGVNADEETIGKSVWRYCTFIKWKYHLTRLFSCRFKFRRLESEGSM